MSRKSGGTHHRLNFCLIKCYAFHNMELCAVWKLPELTDGGRLFIFLSKLRKSCGRIIFPFCACVKIVKVWNRSAEDESFASLDEKSAKCKFIDFSHLSWWPDGGRLDILIQRYQKPNIGPKVL